MPTPKPKAKATNEKAAAKAAVKEAVSQAVFLPCYDMTAKHWRVLSINPAGAVYKAILVGDAIEDEATAIATVVVFAAQARKMAGKLE